MSLVTVPQYKTWARDEKPTADNTVIQSALTAAEAWLNHACARQFVKVADDAVATTRVYTPTRHHGLLRIHDATEVATITESGTTVAESRYQLEPINGLSAAGELVPYEQVRLKPGFWWTPFGEATVSVTAKWGWPEIPALIVEACKVLAKSILDTRNTSLGIAFVTDAGGVSARMDPVVRQAIETYRRVESWGIA